MAPDPLQNILDCAAMILWSRGLQARLKPEHTAGYRLLQMVGEMDHVCEIHRQMEELGLWSTLMISM